MKKHNDSIGSAPELDGLLQKLKERHDAREQSGIYASEEEFKRRFFQAAHAPARPRFPMIWKLAAGLAVCLLSIQLVLITLRDDSSGFHAGGYGTAAAKVDGGAPAANAVVSEEKAEVKSAEADGLDRQALVEARAAAPMKKGRSAPAMENVRFEFVESMATDDDAGDVAEGAVLLTAAADMDFDEAAPAEGGFSVAAAAPMGAADEMPAASGFAARSANGGMGGFGGGMGGFGGGMGGFGGAEPASVADMRPRPMPQFPLGMSRMTESGDSPEVAQLESVGAADRKAEKSFVTANALARTARPEAAAADRELDVKAELALGGSAPDMKMAQVATMAASGAPRGARTMNETQDLIVRPRPRPFVEPPVILPPIRILPPPRPADPKLVPVVVSEVSASVRIRGEIASTVFEAVVTNPNPLALEGEFVLPLPAGATVTGAALDINGKMIDASIVEKKRAQEVFEAIERKGADPALVESVGGNSYRTRVYPIPANGSRRVRITFISEVDRVDGAPIFTLPMRFENTLDKASIRVEVMDPSAAPQVESAPFSNLDFTRWENALLAERTLEHIALPEDLRITVADRPAPVQVERFGGENFFLVSATMPATATAAAFQAPKSVSVLWDASGSRASNDHAPELELLKQFFASAAMKAATVDVSVSVLRNTLEPAKTFTVKDGDASALLDFLRKTAYDGGTDLLGLEKFLAAVPADACAFVFTDGIQTFGRGAKTIPAAKGRTAFVSVSTTSETSYLEYLAEASGANALYLNLARMTPAAAVKDFLAEAPAALESVKIDGSDAPGTVAGARTIRAGGVVRIAGTFPDGKHKLEVKIAGQPALTLTFDLDSASAIDGRMIRTLYGMMKLETLKRDPKTAQADFLSLGREYGLVTPGTSMLVLESLDQYLEYGIRPPETLPDYRAKFDEHKAKLEKDKAKENADEKTRVANRIDELAKRYQSEIVDWYDGKKRPDPVRKGGFGGGGGMRPMNAAGAMGGGMGGFGGAARNSAPRDLSRSVEADGMAFDAMPAMEMAVMEDADEAVAETRAAGGSVAKKESAPDRASKSIQLNPWTSGASYLKELEDAKDKAEDRYLELRAKNADNLGFFVDCADFFARSGRKEFAIRVVSNLAEMQLENRMLLRVLGYNLKYLGELDAAEIVFRSVLELAPEEPQSYRDLALVLAAAKQWQAAADMMLNAIVKKPDGRFRDVELIAITELNDIIVKAKREGVEVAGVDPRLVHPLELDLRVTIGWDTDMSDMDLHTIDPVGEECFFQRRLTTNGGRNSFDITQGYGPEEFMVRAALNGDYKIRTHYYGQRAQKMIGPVTLYAEITTDFGRPEEKTETLMFRLATRDEMVDVATVATKGSKVVPRVTYPPKTQPADDPDTVPVVMTGGAAPDVSRLYQVRANETLEDIAESQLGDRSRAADIARENRDKLRDGQPVTGSILTLPPRNR